MHPGHRAAFNAAFTPALAAHYAQDLAARAGRAPGFRLAETPVFLTEDLDTQLSKAAKEILEALGVDLSIAANHRPAAQSARVCWSRLS